LAMEARPEVAGDAQGMTTEARTTSSPWASHEGMRERGVSVRFDRTVLVGLTTGSDQWAPPEGLVVI
jgi:hypothetical protein